ncbi:hypothetical protein [Streptomyces bicolor]|uniref:hypothetical protein n=1 Tax=Streptomyces bicolor TaxID=66874 RepID=UPI00131B7512|nr:hypothetical protein [Streptomyces bicolor]
MAVAAAPARGVAGDGEQAGRVRRFGPGWRRAMGLSGAAGGRWRARITASFTAAPRQNRRAA